MHEKTSVLQRGPAPEPDVCLGHDLFAIPDPRQMHQATVAEADKAHVPTLHALPELPKNLWSQVTPDGPASPPQPTRGKRGPPQDHDSLALAHCTILALDREWCICTSS